MGVVHLAQTLDGRRVALKVLRPHIVGDAEARERLAREVSSLRRVTSPRVAEILDADPHGPTPYVVTRYVPGLSLYHHVAEEGPISRPRPGALRRRPGRRAAGRALGRGAAPRRQADQRADGGPLARPHRLRPGPAGRRPAAHPDRVPARDARVPRAGDPLRRGRHPRLRRARVGGHRRLRRDREAAVRPRPGDGRDGPRPSRGARPVRCPRGDRRDAARLPRAGALAAPVAERGARLAGRAAEAAPGRATRRARAVDDAVLPVGAHEHAARGGHAGHRDRAPARAGPATAAPQ